MKQAEKGPYSSYSTAQLEAGNLSPSQSHDILAVGEMREIDVKGKRIQVY